MSGEGYLLPNEAEGAQARLEAISALFDPATFRHFERIGVGSGWRCWEVGAGGSSVVTELARRVGPSGRVLATDIDTTGVETEAGASVEVRRHDVALDPPPAERFDLVHARLVLVHVPQRDEALGRMVAALRPGGWLLVEDADPALQPLACPDAAGQEQQLANHVRNGFRLLLSRRGADLAYGRKLPRLLREAGLEDVGAEACFPLAHPACGMLEAATIRMLRADLTAAGLAADEEIDRLLEAIEAGRLDLATAPMVSAWGRRP